MHSTPKVEEDNQPKDSEGGQCEVDVAVAEVPTEKQHATDKEQAYKDAVLNCIRKDLW